MKHFLPLLILLIFGACQPKRDLVQKAFSGKTFDRRLPGEEVDDVVPEPPPETKEEVRKEAEVIVDNLKPKPEASVFMATGEDGRPTELSFPKDPEAPSLNMEEAKLYDIIHAICNLLGLNYIIDPSVKDQTVTIGMTNNSGKLKTSELLDLLLKLHDLTIVRRDPFIYIVPLNSPEATTSLHLLYGTKPNPNMGIEEMVIQLVPLKYVKPTEMGSVLKTFLSAQARILEEPKNNILILIDKAPFITKALEMVPIFDVDLLSNKRMIYYPLNHVDVVETTAKLQEILAVYGYEANGDRLNLVPIETLNGILVVGNNESIFKEIDYWIKKFDQEAQLEESQIFVYHIENTTAASLSQTLSQLYGFSGGSGRVSAAASSRRTTNPNRNAQEDASRTADNKTNTTNQASDKTGATNPTQRAGSSGGSDASGGKNESGDQMIVDEDNNALIFMTTPREFARIRKTLKKLDILPRQVFLEVAVLTVALTDSYASGIAWGFTGDQSLSQTINRSGGLSFDSTGSSAPSLTGSYNFVGQTTQLKATINAAKTKGYANVLQQPHIMAIDNKAAQISVGSDIPITTNRTNIGNIPDGGAQTPAQSSTIQYRQTGVTLAFTPHINANGVIRLEIGLDISEPGAGGTTDAPAISQNSLETEMIVRDSQTIVMGGLIFDQDNWGKDTIPLLGRIPLLKHLFTNRNSSNTKRELIVMITPRLIDTEEKSIEISKEFREKILKEFDSFQRN